MRYLTLGEVIALHRNVVADSGGSAGIRDLALLDSALAQPKVSYGGQDLHPTLIDKAAALCTSLVQNHPFVDGNKRIGHAAMEVFLILNGLEISASVDEQEKFVLRIATGELSRQQVADWLGLHVTPVGMQ